MKKEAITHGVLEDLANRNENWDKLDGVINQVNELEESRLILKNEIVNGDFSNGTTGWLTTGLTLSIVDGRLRAKSTGTIEYPYVTATRKTISSIGEKVYLATLVKVHDSETNEINLRFGSAGIVSQKILPTANVNYFLSAIVTQPSTTTNPIIQSVYASTIISKDKILEITYATSINLTQVFGKGNEPTKEEMDIITDTIGYFNGEHVVTDTEQFNILLRMVRENTLATTSLGGGF